MIPIVLCTDGEAGAQGRHVIINATYELYYFVNIIALMRITRGETP